MTALTQWSGSLGSKYAMRNAHAGRSGAINRLKREAKLTPKVSLADVIEAAGTRAMLANRIRRVKS